MTADIAKHGPGRPTQRRTPHPAPLHAPVGRSAALGAVLGVDAVGHCIALATLCFAGGLGVGLGLGTTAFVLGSMVVTLAQTFIGRLPYALGVSQDTSISLLAPAAVAAGLAASGPVEANVVTTFAVLGLSAIVSGLIFWLVGRFRLGRIVRTFPYPVAAGFLASSGCLLVLAALSVLCAPAGQVGMMAALADPAIWPGLIPAVLFVAALMLSIRWLGGLLGMLAVVTLALLGFYAVLAGLGIDTPTAWSLHLLPSFGDEGPIGITGLALSDIDWSAVALTTPIIASVALINLVALLLNATGIELSLETEVNIDRELRVVGGTNLLIGLFGGIAAFAQGGVNVFAGQLGARRVALSLGYVLVLAAACTFATALVGAVPIFIAAGLLIFIGVTMIDSWLFQTRHRLRRTDWAIVCGIVAVTLILGILAAVLAGLFLAVLSFAITSARLPVVDFITDGRLRRSVVDRSLAENARLSEQGDRIQILHLQGALFFGSVENLATIVGRLLAEVPRTGFIILDFDEVDMIDSSGCVGLSKLRQTLERRGVVPVFAGLNRANRDTLTRWAASHEGGEQQVLGVRTAHSLDDALEVCEGEILGQDAGPDAPRSLAALLAELSGADPRADELARLMERVELKPGEALIQQGAATADIYFVESGRLSVRITSASGAGLRVRSLGPGAVVGEMAHILDLPRSTDVVAETAVLVHRLGGSEVMALRRDDPALAALLYHVLAHALSRKLLNANTLIGDIKAPRHHPALLR